MAKNKVNPISNSANKADMRIIGEIGWSDNSSEAITRKIDQLIANGKTDFDCYLNSPGGGMDEVNEIGNQVLRFSGKKTLYVGALAASAAATLTTYFDHVEGAGNSQYMIHDPSTVIFIEHIEDFDSNKKRYENLRNDAIKRYSDQMNVSAEEVSEMMGKTTWMNAEEAKALGLIDAISDENDQLPKNTAEVFNKMKLKNIPAYITKQIQNLNNSAEQAPPKNTSKPIVMKEVLNALGLSENATEAEALAAVKNLKDNAVKAVTELANHKGLKSDSIGKLAESDLSNTLGMVIDTKIENKAAAAPKEEKKEGEEAGEKKEGGNDLVNSLVKTLENSLKTSVGDGPKNLKDMSPEEREVMAEKEPEKYQALVDKAYSI